MSCTVAPGSSDFALRLDEQPESNACWEAVTHRRGRRGRHCSAPTGSAAQAIRVGSTVARGCDWQRGDDDGGEGSTGVVQAVGANGWVEVSWPNGHSDIYRYDAEGKFDLVAVLLTDTPQPLPTSTSASRASYTALTTHDDELEDDHTKEAAWPSNVSARCSASCASICCKAAIKAQHAKVRQRSISSQSTHDDELEALEEALQQRALSVMAKDTEASPLVAGPATPYKPSANRSRPTMVQHPQALAAAVLSMELFAIAAGLVTSPQSDEPKKKPSGRHEIVAGQPSGKSASSMRSRPVRATQMRGARGR